MPKYAEPARARAFYRQVFAACAPLPGVDGAAYISFLPMVMRGGIWPVTVDGAEVDPRTPHTASLRLVTPGSSPPSVRRCSRPRRFAADGPDGPRVAVVSAVVRAPALAGARPARPAGATRLRRGHRRRRRAATSSVRGLERESEPQVYLASAQVPDGGLMFYAPKDLVVRSTRRPPALVPELRRIVAAAIRSSRCPTSGRSPTSWRPTRRASCRCASCGRSPAWPSSWRRGIHGVLAYSVAWRA